MSGDITIQYENVHKRFDTPVLSGVSLSVMRGERRHESERLPIEKSIC